MQDQQGRLQNGLELLESTENVQVNWGSSSTGTFSLDLLPLCKKLIEVRIDQCEVKLISGSKY